MQDCIVYNFKMVVVCNNVWRINKVVDRCEKLYENLLEFAKKWQGETRVSGTWRHRTIRYLSILSALLLYDWTDNIPAFVVIRGRNRTAGTRREGQQVTWCRCGTGPRTNLSHNRAVIVWAAPPDNCRQWSTHCSTLRRPVIWLLLSFLPST